MIPKGNSFHLCLFLFQYEKLPNVPKTGPYFKSFSVVCWSLMSWPELPLELVELMETYLRFPEKSKLRLLCVRWRRTLPLLLSPEQANFFLHQRSALVSVKKQREAAHVTIATQAVEINSLRMKLRKPREKENPYRVYCSDPNPHSRQNRRTCQSRRRWSSDESGSDCY